MPEYYVKDGDEYKPLEDDHIVLSKSELESKYESKAKFGESVQAEINRRFANHVHKDKAHEDESIIARVLESHSGADVNEDELRKRWESAHLKPLQEKYSSVEERAKTLEAQVKYREMGPVLESAGFDDSFYTRPEPGKPSPAEIYFGDKFILDDGNLAIEGSNTSPAEYAKELASMESYKRFLKPEARNASRTGRPGQETGGGSGSGLTQTSLNKDAKAKADYIEKHGYARSHDGGVPFCELPK